MNIKHLFWCSLNLYNTDTYLKANNRKMFIIFLLCVWWGSGRTNEDIKYYPGRPFGNLIQHLEAIGCQFITAFPSPSPDSLNYAHPNSIKLMFMGRTFHSVAWAGSDCLSLIYIVKRNLNILIKALYFHSLHTIYIHIVNSIAYSFHRRKENVREKGCIHFFS